MRHNTLWCSLLWAASTCAQTTSNLSSANNPSPQPLFHAVNNSTEEHTTSSPFVSHASDLILSTTSGHTTASTTEGNEVAGTLPTAGSSTNVSATFSGCTGCVLEAINPTTVFDIGFTLWKSTLTTITVMTKTVTYMDGPRIDTIVTEYETIRAGPSPPGNRPALPTTPVFTWVPTEGTTLTLEVGPTYVAYTNLWGALDYPTFTQTSSDVFALPTCTADVRPLDITPTATQDYQFFIETYRNGLPTRNSNSAYTSLYTLPPSLIRHLSLNSAIASFYNGSNIATCTLRPTRTPQEEQPISTRVPPQFPGSTTSTYLSSTYASTSTHVTRDGCLRCSVPQLGPVTPGPAGPRPSESWNPQDLRPTNLPELIDSVINDPRFTGLPKPGELTVGKVTATADSRGRFVIGTQTLSPGGPQITVDGNTLSLGPTGTIAIVNGVTRTLANAPIITRAPVLTLDGQAISATVIGAGTTAFVFAPGQTLTHGGAVTFEGTTFSMPAGGSGLTIVVNGETFALLDMPMILDRKTITASVISGTTAFVLAPGHTLTLGGTLIFSGTTFSFPTSASGTEIVINGWTSTLRLSAVTPAAALTIEGKTYSATVRDGTTEYVLGEGITLKPGGAITISGTTYALDPAGTALVINGQTSSIQQTPVSNAASTTLSSVISKTDSSLTLPTTTTLRNPGDSVASGVETTKKPGAAMRGTGGLERALEGLVLGVAGWIMIWL